MAGPLLIGGMGAILTFMVGGLLLQMREKSRAKKFCMSWGKKVKALGKATLALAVAVGILGLLVGTRGTLAHPLQQAGKLALAHPCQAVIITGTVVAASVAIGLILKRDGATILQQNAKKS